MGGAEAMKASAVLLLASPLLGQEVVWERTGQPNQTVFGDYAKFIGDVDADGVDDLVMRVWGLSGWREELWLLSGRDGSTLHRQSLPTGNQPYFDTYGPAGDMDGDGTPDFVFTAYENQSPWLDHVEVHSGRDGALILRLRNPSLRPFAPSANVLSGRDLTGDGRPDLIFRWVVDAATGIVGAVDHTGRSLYYYYGSWATRSFTVGSGQRGNDMGWIGDLDRDGADDFALGSYDAAVGRHVTYAMSGRTGLPLVTGVSADPREGIGWSADGCGDIDLDGVPDFVACSGLAIGERGLAQVFSGRTGQTIRSWGSPSGERGPGGVMRGGGFDYDRDGVPDLVFHWGTNFGEGGIYLCSGRDGAWMHRVLFCPNQGGTSGSCAYGSSHGSSIEVGRPQPGHPYPVFLFPEPYYGSAAGWPLGRIRMYRGTPAGVEPYGHACSGTLPSTPQMGIRNLQGIGVRLHLSNAPRAAYAALALGFSRTQWNGMSLPLSLAGFGLPGCSLFTSADALITIQTGTVGLSAGYGSLDLPLPLRPPGQATFVLHGQWLVLDPTISGAATTDALLWRH